MTDNNMTDDFELQIVRLRDHFEDVEGDEDFMGHIGLDTETSWDDFLWHYLKVDEDRVADNLLTYPPVAEKINELSQSTD